MTAEMTPALDQLRAAIRNTPIIDNHAHNLLSPDQLKTEPFLSATSEATGEALKDHVTALPHFRAARQLRTLYDLPADADWDAILKRRHELLESGGDALFRKCLQRTYTILVDDGLEGSFQPYDWHDQFTASPCKRIVRIEAIAATILSAMHKHNKLPVSVDIADEEACALAWVAFITAFEQAIVASIEDDEVVGFKSVICYRTGLDVVVDRDTEVADNGLRSFRRHFLPHCVQSNFRVESKGMNDALVISACKLISAASKADGHGKPFQFHTGLGDNDITLLDSNPAVMQPLIKAFPEVPFVLLHSSYPYTREAGYLAMAYKHVYLDLGEVFPMVSRDGQEQIIRQALEITPTSKLLWSTDGHHFPETYYLANLQGREVIGKILCEYVENQDLSVSQAVRAVKDILFENSNKLYDLGLHFPDVDQLSESPTSKETSPNGAALQLPPSSYPPSQQNFARFQSLAQNGNVQYIFVQWLDYMAQMRSRWVPIEEFEKLMTKGPGRLTISRGNLGTTPNDHMSSVCNPVGSIYVEPDLESFRLMQDKGPVKNAATVMSRFVDDDGAALGVCPRAVLGELVTAFEHDHGITFLVGFEIEITFCRRNSEGSNDTFSPLDTTHSWGTFTDEQYMKSVGLMTSIATVLQSIGVAVEQLHSEAGAGQYEFVLSPLPIVQAVDTLIQARQCIQQIAATHGLRATCHPMPFPGIGTAAHAHISLNSTSLSAADLESASSFFMASVLTHLPAICSMTMPQQVSYNRVVDDSWTGGTWVAWGTNNRETPLRRVTSNRWEIRCLDGIANMYLALAAMLSAGLAGVQMKMPLEMKDCHVNPTMLSDEQKTELGIVTRMPRDLEAALTALDADEELKDLMGEELTTNWLAVKRAEQEMLGEMSEKDRRVWLMERY